MTPQQLMDMQNAGAAEMWCRANKKWDETRAIVDGNSYSFTVKVSGYYDPQVEYEIVTVTAASKREAIEAAYEETDFDEIEDAEIIGVEAVEQ